jgi:hypothetical protein
VASVVDALHGSIDVRRDRRRDVPRRVPLASNATPSTSSSRPSPCRGCDSEDLDSSTSSPGSCSGALSTDVRFDVGPELPAA